MQTGTSSLVIDHICGLNSSAWPANKVHSPLQLSIVSDVFVCVKEEDRADGRVAEEGEGEGTKYFRIS